MKVTRIAHDGPEKVYRVDDDQSIQGVFFVIIDPENKTLAVSSIDLEGLPDQADMILLSARVPAEAPEEEHESFIWTYVSEKDLADKLIGLLGTEATVVMTDLGAESAVDPQSQAWQAAMAGMAPVAATAPPAMVQADEYSFEFDPHAGDPLDPTLSAGSDAADVAGGLPPPAPDGGNDTFDDAPPDTGEPGPDAEEPELDAAEPDEDEDKDKKP